MDKFNYYSCKCSSDITHLTTRYFLSRLIEELIEFIQKPSLDELSDVMCICSNIVYTITGLQIYLPLAKRSFDKGRKRVEQHGCVRSYRNRCNK